MGSGQWSVRQWSGVALVVAAANLTACSGAEVNPSPEASLTPTSTTAPTVAVAQACPTGNENPALPDTTLVFQQPGLITDYLNSGGDVDQLVGALESAGLIPDHEQAWPSAMKDLTGDGLLDLAISLHDPSSSMMPQPAGSLFVWLCREAEYVLVHQTQPETDHSAPVLLAVADLNGNGASDVVFGRPVCGAHTCFLELGVLEWDGDRFVDRFRGSSRDLASPEVLILLPSATAPGTISVTSHGVQSVGAGPPRPLTRRWIWSQVAGAFVPDTEFLAAPVYRIHVVHDGDRAFREGHPRQAEYLYLKALDSPSLLEWEADPATPASLEGYVRYRLVLNALAESQVERAQSARDELAAYAEATPAAQDYLAMAQILLNHYQESLDLSSACAEVRAFAEAHAAAVLEPLYYGYGNPTYTAEDVCPVD
ncbi:MAG TPA: hypothetical protein VFI11_11940 [Anaerolineales bacterium]|nr:hypothetical protein [Anaerolineales bacterium]